MSNSFNGKSVQQNFRKILIILPRQLGDILLGSSLAFAARSAFPGAHICWVSHPMGRQLLEGHPALNKVIYHPVWKPRSLGTWLKSPVRTIRDLLNYWREEIKFFQNLRSAQFELVVDAICTPKTALMAFLTRARSRHGLATRWNRNWAYTWLCNGSHWQNKYAAQSRLELFGPLIDPQILLNPPQEWLDSWMPVSDKMKERVDAIISELKLTPGKFAILSPTSRRALRQWPGSFFVQLAETLVVEDEVKVCWFWGPGEYDFTLKLHQALQEKLKAKNLDSNASCIPPLLSLGEAAYMSGLSSIWIGNTNGLSHVAVAGGARTVQIFGPTSHEAWTHPNNARHAPVQRDRGCVRCESNTCRTGTHECMKHLTVEDVLIAVRKVKRVSDH
ncbi:MAG: glycosyltransferase family 9 protein [Silvanigrellaceae bacterium]